MAQPQGAPLNEGPSGPPLAPLPLAISLGTDEAGNILVRIADPGGVRFYFLGGALAVAIGERMAALGRQALLRPATKRLVVAAAKNGKVT